MAAVALALFAGLFAVARLTVRTKVAAAILYVYLGWWAICILVSTLDPLGLEPVSLKTYILLLLNVTTFAVGYVAAGNRSTRLRSDFGTLRDSYERSLQQSRLVQIMLALLFAYLLYYYLRYRMFLEALGPAEARNIRFDAGTVFPSASALVLYNYVVGTMTYLLQVVVAFCVVYGYMSTLTFWMSLADLVLIAALGAGRTSIVGAVLFLSMTAIIRALARPAPTHTKAPLAPWRRRVADRGRKTILLATAMLAFGYAVYLTNIRTGPDVEPELSGPGSLAFLNQVVVYSVGPFRALDHALRNEARYGVYYGRLTFAAIDEIVGYTFVTLGFDYDVANSSMGAFLREPIDIGVSFNALYTGLFPLYFDWGWAGVIVFPLLLGALLRICVSYFSAYPCMSTLAILLFLFSVAFFSMQAWFLCSPAALFVIATAALFFRHEKKVLFAAEGPAPSPSQPMWAIRPV